MSSTYSLNKHATALLDRHAGTIFYILSEETTESNVHPRIGHWSTFFMGSAQECMKRVIDTSESCEGGMLTGPGGRHIKPESYIRQWRNALEAPTSMEDRVISVHFGDGFYDLPAKTRPTLERLASAHGVKLDSSGVWELVSCDPGVLQLLTSFTQEARCDGGYIWRIFRSAPIHGPVRTDLGYKVESNSKVEGLGDFRVLKLPMQLESSDQSHLLVANGEVVATGWSYSTVGEYIRRFACMHEVNVPGSAEASIRAFRKVLASASPVPKSMTVLIKRGAVSVDGCNYKQRTFDAMASALGLGTGLQEFRTTVVEACAADFGRALQQLGDEQVFFDEPPCDLSAHAQSNGAQQHLLLV